MQQAVSFESSWEQLKPVLTSILCNERVSIDNKRWMQTYDLVYKVVSKSQDKCPDLYEAIVAMFKARALALVAQARTLPDEELMRFFSECWLRWCKSAKVISHMCSYLERMWIDKRIKNGDKNLLRLVPKTDEIWRETLFVVGLKEKLCPAMVNFIQEEREGGVIQGHLIRNCVDCLRKMDDIAKTKPLTTYREHFEHYYIQRSREYYVNESANVLRSGNPNEYMLFVDRKYKEEQTRIDTYLDPSTKKPMMEMMDSVLLHGHAESFQSLFEAALAHNSVGDIACLYRLLKRVNAVGPLIKMFETHVEEYGRNQLESVKEEMAKEPRVFVETILSIYRRYSRIVIDAFLSNKEFTVALDSALASVINHNTLTTGTGTANSTSAVLLAKYCDGFLRRGSTVEGADIEQLQNDVVSLFKYLPDKDVFMQFYTKLMAKRLIMGYSAGEELEGSMVNKLKSVQGSDFTTKAAKMISEVSVNETLNADFQTFLTNKRAKPTFSVNLMVLSSGSWPIAAPQMSITLPLEVDAVMKSVIVFYAQKHKERKLSHTVNLSHAEISYTTTKTKYQVAVTAFQMVILLYASKHSSVTLREFSNETQIPNKLLCQQLSPVVRSHLFTCSEGTDISTWNDETVFSLNPKFAFKRMKLSLMSATGSSSSSSHSEGGAKKSAGEGAQVADMDHGDMEDIARDRAIKLEAAIVRIMKSRRMLGYNALVKEVIEQVQRWFTPQISMIKRAIESLLDQEFIRRSSGDSRTFEYIA